MSDDLFTSGATDDLFTSEVSAESFEEINKPESIIDEFEESDYFEESTNVGQENIIYFNSDDTTGLFTSSIKPENESISESVGNTEGYTANVDQGTKTRTGTEDDSKEEIEILKQILLRMPERAENESTETTEAEEQTEAEESTETTTDGYIYHLQNIQSQIQQIEEKQTTQIKNYNISIVTIIILISALFGAFFVNLVIGRIR